MANEVFGIGTDIVECVRIARMIERHGEIFLRRVYTEHEITYCQTRKLATPHFAGRWAAKEAVLKAVGTGWRRGISWRDVEIHNQRTGQPIVRVGGMLKEIIIQLGIADVLVSISHCREYATAYAVALRKPLGGASPAP